MKRQGWPREGCPDPNAGANGLVASTVVPKGVVEATCEMARELLLVDRTAAPPGEGIERQHNIDYSETVYSKSDTRKIITPLARAMLERYGGMVGGGMVKIQRV
jgi:hypothetical protein